MAAAERNGALPDDLRAVGDDEVRRVGADVEDDDATLLAAGRVLGRSLLGRVRATLLEQLVGGEIAQRQRGHLHGMHIAAGPGVVSELAGDDVALHGEQANLGLHGEAADRIAAADLLEVPDDFVEREGDLLLRLELDDVRDFLLLNRRQLDEMHQPALAGDTDGDLVLANRVAREEFLQRLAGQRLRVGVRLREDFGVFDVVEVRRSRDAVDHLHAQGFQRALANVDAPDADGNGHGGFAPLWEWSPRPARACVTAFRR